MTSLSPTPALRAVLQRIEGLLHGRDAYVVGGTVRDALLGVEAADVDLAVDGDAPETARTLADALEGHLVLLDAERAVARVALDEGPVRTIDLAPLRGGIEADLAGRDFTIDAMAVALAPLVAGEAEVIDPCGGAADLASRTVRMVSERALVDDPLRMLRAVRLAAQLDFTIEASTAGAIRRHGGRIVEAAGERQRDEIARAFATPRAGTAVRLLDGLGLLDRLFPEVAAGRGVTQPKEHYYDVLEHGIETVVALDAMLGEAAAPDERAEAFGRAFWRAMDTGGAGAPLRAYLREEPSEGRPRAALIKLGGLLHDVAKPETKAPDATGRVRFLGHAERGAAIARDVLRRLRFSRREAEFVERLVEEHLRPAQLAQPGEPPTRRALYRFYRDSGDAAEGILVLSLADALAARGPMMTLEAWTGHVAYVAHVLARRYEDESVVRPERLITGHDIMQALGIGPGAEVGRLLAALEEAQASGEVTDRDEALTFIRRTWGEGARAMLVPAAARGGQRAGVAGVGGRG